MQRLLTGNNNRGGSNARPVRKISRGFTLVEIMVVISIIGVMIGLAVVSVGGMAQRELSYEAQRIQQLLRLAYEEAELGQNEIAIAITKENEFVFYGFDEQLMEWTELKGDYFKTRSFEEAYQFELKMLGEELDTEVLYDAADKDKATDYGEEAIFEPDILFFFRWSNDIV